MADQLIWVAPDGTRTSLYPSATFKREPGSSGRFMPTFDFVERAAQYGSSLLQVNMKPRDIHIPAFCYSDYDASAVRQTMRLLSKKFNPSVRGGVGQLEYVAPDGIVRYLNCAYAGGMEAAADARDGLHARFVLTFRAFDPLWYDQNPTTSTFIGGAATATFFPIFPLRLNASQILGDVLVNNPGDVESWPVWTLTGPGNTIILRNLTTRLNISMGALALAGGEGIIIDTRPGKKTVRRADGTNLYAFVSNDTILWPLVPGDNLIRVEMAGTSGVSQAVMVNTPRYLAP